MNTKTAQRKRDHLTLCATDDVAFKSKTTLLEEIDFVHRAAPEIGIKDLDTSLVFAEKKLSAPIWIGSMTGGGKGSAELNRDMAKVAGELGIGLCLGSIRPMLEDPALIKDFIVSDVIGNSAILANIGATEIVRRGPEPILKAVEFLKTDGLIIHLNPAMELIQPGGDTDFKGVMNAISQLVKQRGKVPIIIKETGCGLSWQDGEALKEAGVTTVETGAAGGTSWVGVETLRADSQKARIGKTLWDWGIPTAVSTAWMVDLGFEVIASGGIRSGLDVARALALGAKMTAVAAPLIKARQDKGIDGIREYLDDMIKVLKTVMLILGARKCTDLLHVPRVVGPTLTRWIESGWQMR